MKQSDYHFIEELSDKTEKTARVKTKSHGDRQTWIWFQIVLFINYVTYLKELSLTFHLEEGEQQHYLPYMDGIKN